MTKKIIKGFKIAVFLYAVFMIWGFSKLFVLKKISVSYPEKLKISFVVEEKFGDVIFNYDFKDKKFKEIYRAKGFINEIHWGKIRDNLSFIKCVECEKKCFLLDVKKGSVKIFKLPDKKYERSVKGFIVGNRYYYFILMKSYKKSIPFSKGKFKDILIFSKEDNKVLKKIEDVVDFSISSDENFIIYTTFSFLEKSNDKYFFPLKTFPILKKFEGHQHEIYLYDIRSGEKKFLTVGEYPTFYSNSNRFVFLRLEGKNLINIFEMEIGRSESKEVGEISFLNKEKGKLYLIPDLKKCYFLMFESEEYFKWNKLLEIDFSGKRKYLMGGIEDFAVKYEN